MENLHKVGGVPAVSHRKTLSENVDVPILQFDNQDVVRSLSDPIKSTGHITILRGSLCPGSAVAKLTGKEGLRFEVRTANMLCIISRA